MTATATARVDALSRERPDWAPYVAVVRETAAALTAASPAHPGRTLSASVRCELGRPDDGAPLLGRATIAVDATALETWLLHLLRVAAGHGAAEALGGPDHWAALDAVALARAAIDHDAGRIGDMAVSAGVAADGLLAVAPLAITPVLDACRRAHAPALPGYWPRGSCPVCGAWATLTEARGLDRSLRLRCARCAADWPTEWVRCTICGNRDHETLGSLVTEGVGETRRVDTCEACRGYVKTITSLTAVGPGDVVLEDLASVDLDLIALERGYRKPAPPGALEAHLVATERAPRRRRAARLWLS